MIRTQISLTQEEYALAKQEATRQGVSFAEYLRRALRVVLPVNREKPWMRYAGFVASGDQNSSQTIDELIYGQKD